MLKRYKLIVFILLLSVFCGACAESLISEEPAPKGLPRIDPYSAKQTKQTASLYFAMENEGLLVPVSMEFLVGHQENFFEIVLRELLKGPDKSTTGLNSPIPPRVFLVSAQREKTALRLVLSKELLSTSHIQGSYEDIGKKQRLAVYAIVNTLCSLQFQNIETVEIWVDKKDDGRGQPVSPQELGFFDVQEESLGPLMANDSYNANQINIAELALSYIVEANYERAYSLFYNENKEDLPNIDEFRNQFKYNTPILSYAVKEIKPGSNPSEAIVVLDVKIKMENSREMDLQDIEATMRRQDNIFKLNYQALVSQLLSGN